MKSKKNHLYRGMIASCSLLLLVSMANSQDKPRVSSQLFAFKVVKAESGESLAPTKAIKPGEILEYQLRYSNDSPRGVKNVNVTLPIPAGLEYLSSSAKPTEAQASTDGRTFSAMPLRRMEKNANGVTVMVTIPTSEYRFLRWSISSLPAGDSATVAARVRLVDALTAAKVPATPTKTNR
jgi:uncharacterized repeat protein (TIGR01451 family)